MEPCSDDEDLSSPLSVVTKANLHNLNLPYPKFRSESDYKESFILLLALDFLPFQSSRHYQPSSQYSLPHQPFTNPTHLTSPTMKCTIFFATLMGIATAKKGHKRKCEEMESRCSKSSLQRILNPLQITCSSYSYLSTYANEAASRRGPQEGRNVHQEQLAGRRMVQDQHLRLRYLYV